MAEKRPVEFFVWFHQGQSPMAVPAVAQTPAGENRVTVRNILDLDVEVTHNGALIAPNPFIVPARTSGPPTEVTYRVHPDADKAGNVVTLRLDSVNNNVRTRLSALSAAGDPQIIIF